MKKRTVLLVGEKNDTLELGSLLRREGMYVDSVYQTREAFEKAKEIEPVAIAIVVPQYWSSVIFLIKALRESDEFKNTPIYYMGELVEGGDLKRLKAMDVRVISIGPVPFSEVVRQMMAEIGH